MNTATTTYEPTDYEQMLIAAGWVTIESLDDDYQEYVSRVGKYEAVGYEGWRSMVCEMTSLSCLWDSTIEPVITGYQTGGRNLNGDEKQIEKQIIERTSYLELVLGY